MRSRVLSNRMGLLLKASSLSVLAGLIAGCSSGFQRFDTTLYDSALPAQSSQNSNPYPGDGVDEITTSSVGSALRPIATVAPPVYDQTYAHAPSPEPTNALQQRAAYSAPKTYQPYAQKLENKYQNTSGSVRQNYSDAKSKAQATYQRAAAKSWDKGSISGTSLSRPSPSEVANSTISKSNFAKKAKEASNLNYYTDPVASGAGSINRKVGSQGTDAIKTSSVTKIEPASYKVAHSEHQMNDASHGMVQNTSAEAKESNGWSSVGGTKVMVRSGETLYNLSKRYGVPAEAIQKVNGIDSETSLQAGQQILIPNYVFSPTSKVSAPDSDPRTRAARASTGMVGEANANNIAVPTRRPYQQMAAVTQNGEIPKTEKRRYKPKIHVIKPEEAAPDYSIVTGSVPKDKSATTYEVVSGDTLYKVYRKTGVSVEKLKSINGLKNDNIRIGQKLELTGTAPMKTAKVEAPAVKPTEEAKKVDPVTTQAFKKTVRNLRVAQLDSDEKAPASTGIGQFRWPVHGRVISKFGKGNEGIDISVPEGTAVKAVENGVVIYAGKEISSYGNLILVRHANDWVSAYAHNKSFNVKKGDKVTRGQTIAKSGKTGSANRPKVHFELRKSSKPVDPMKHLSS